MHTRLIGALIFAASLVGVGVPLDTHAQAIPTFSIDWYVISPGGTQLRNSCFVVSGTSGQPVPGYSSGGAYALLSGFWSIALIAGNDTIFFNGFEGCSP